METASICDTKQTAGKICAVPEQIQPTNKQKYQCPGERNVVPSRWRAKEPCHHQDVNLEVATELDGATNRKPTGKENTYSKNYDRPRLGHGGQRWGGLKIKLRLTGIEIR